LSEYQFTEQGLLLPGS